MRWQIGGNLEPVRIICETDWGQCPRAILKYIWSEVVTDVVDCLIAEETAWRTIAILVACMMFLRILYAKRKCADKPIPSEETLNRVGCKVEDLELKINILTYKLQYGTWPHPHKIRNPALRKQLRNLRLTLSTSGDRNAWIKRMLLGSTPDICSSAHQKFDSASVQRITEIFNTKIGYVPSEISRDIMPTDYDDMVKTCSKATSVESLEINDPKNNNQRGLSKSENLGKLHRTSTRLSFLPQNGTSLECLNWRKKQKQKRSKFSPTSQSRLAASCDGYTESIRECKRFLQELKKSKEEMEPEYSSSASSSSSSSSMLSNDDSFMKETCRDEKVISTRCIVPEITKKSIELEFSLNEQNRIISGDVTFCPLKSSLHAQTTDAVGGGGVERMPAQVEREEKKFEKTITNREISIRDAPNGSVSSFDSTTDGHDNLTTNFLIEPSTNIDIPPGDNVIKISRETLHMIKDKFENLDDALRASYGTLNSRITSIGEAKEDGNDIRLVYQNVIETFDDMKVEIESINETRKNAEKYKNKLVQTISSSRELSERSDESFPTKMNFIPNKEEQKDLSTREMCLSRKDMEQLSRFPVPMEIDEDPSITSTTSSQREMSMKDGDLESESTALLIREALECKRELLSRVKLQKFYSNIELGRNNENYKNTLKSDNIFYRDTKQTFASNLLDIIAEERSTISGCTDKTSRTYIFLRMKEPISELSDRSLLSLKVDLSDSKQEGPIRELSKDTMIPIASSRYFSINNDFAVDRTTYDRIMDDDRSDRSDPSDPSDPSNALHDFRQLGNIIFDKVPTDGGQLLNEKNAINDANSLRGKKRHKEIATCDNDDTGDNRIKRLCHRANVQNSSTSLLHRTKSGQDSYRVKSKSNERSGSVSTISNIDKLLRGGRMFVESSNNGSMTNFSSNTDSNVKTIDKYPVIAKNDNDETTLCTHDLALKRRPGTFAFARPKINARKIMKDPSNLIITNPYFFTETTLSEVTCGDSIEINLIPLSASAATTIDSRDSRIFTVARSNILRNITGVSSTLQISYKDDIENGNIAGIIKNELGNNEVLATRSVKSVDSTMNIEEKHENYEKVTVTSNNRIEERIQQSEYIKIEATDLKFPNEYHTDINNANLIDNNEVSTKSRSTVISQESSCYFTGDNLSSTNELDVKSFIKSNGNIEVDPDVRRIAIKSEILESRKNFCLDSLNDSKVSNTNHIPLQAENKASVGCVDDNKHKNNKTSIVSYVDANTSKTFEDDVHSRYEASLMKERPKRSGLFFDGSIPYRKPSTTRSFVKNVTAKLAPQTRNRNPIKSNPTKADIKSKSTISVDRPTHSKESTAVDLQLKAKSNFSIIGSNGKDHPTDFTVSRRRPSSSFNLSRDKSRSHISCCESESFSTISTAAARSEDKSKEKEMLREKQHSNLGTHRFKQSLSCPKSFSKSCIPVLKSRLEARKGEQISRPKSPTRGPLTMTGLRRNKIDDNVRNITELSVPTEGNTFRKERSQRHLHNSETTKEEEIDEEEKKSINAQFITKSPKVGTNAIDKNFVSLTPREQTVLYVNIVQQHDRNIILDYAKGESIAQNESDMKLEPDMLLPKIVTIVSSVSDEPNVNAKDDDGSSNLRISTGTLKSLWSVTIQQKEIEVTAKPSVTDTSTSISDLQRVTEPLHEHRRIFGIPKDITDEEFSYILEILTRKPNLAHLKKIQNLCNRLGSRNENSD